MSKKKKKFESKIANNWVSHGLMDLSTPEKRAYWRKLEEMTSVVDDWPEWKRRATLGVIDYKCYEEDQI